MKHELKWTVILFVAGICTTVISAYTEKGNTQRINNKKRAYLADWPITTKLAAEQMLKTYGEPDAESDETLIWLKKEDRKQIIIQKFDE